MKVKLQNVRIAFAQTLVEPEAFQGEGEKRHGCTFLLTPDSESLKAVNKAIEDVAAEKWGKKAEQVLDSIDGNAQKICLYEGKKKAYDGFEGMWALSANRKAKDGPPSLVDQDKSKLLRWNAEKDCPLRDADGKLQWAEGKEGRIYSGCYVNATVNIWAQDNSYGKGIRAELVGVQFFRDGDSFGGATRPDDDDFEDLSDGAEQDAEDALA